MIDSEARLGDLGVAEPLRDQGDHLGLPRGQSFGTPRASRPRAVRLRRTGLGDDDLLAGVHRPSASTSSAAVSALERYAETPCARRPLDEPRLDVPGVDDDVADRAGCEQLRDVRAVALGLGERVVERDVHRLQHGTWAVELDDLELVACTAQHLRETADDHLVVVDDGEPDGHAASLGVLERFELAGVVRAEHRDLVGALGAQLLQPGQVRPARRLVGGRGPLEGPQRRRTPPRTLEVTAVEVGVAGVEQPPATGASYGDTGVAATVTVERDHDDVVPDRLGGREAEPLVAAGAVLDPVRAVPPLGLEVPRAVAERGVEGGVQLGPVDVDAGVREVREAAGVVEVEVGDDDVAHVGGVEPQAASCEWAVSEGSSRGPNSVVKARPRRRAPSATSSVPNPVSTRVSPVSPSMRRQWVTITRAPGRAADRGAHRATARGGGRGSAPAHRGTPGRSARGGP